MFTSCDRLNLVQYLPELGIVVAASQAGGVAIITLTWQEEIGHTFRVDWLLPFPTQERDDECPTPPLMGIAASPMPGFEMPPDVPCIPRDVNPKDRLRFNHRLLNPDGDEPSTATRPNAGLPVPPIQMLALGLITRTSPSLKPTPMPRASTNLMRLGMATTLLGITGCFCCSVISRS